MFLRVKPADCLYKIAIFQMIGLVSHEKEEGGESEGRERAREREKGRERREREREGERESGERERFCI